MKIDYIVRIRSFLDGDCIQYGTGIIISNNYIITAKHIINGDRCCALVGDKEVELHEVESNDAGVLMKSEESLGKSGEVGFCVEEVLNAETEWEIQGYITAAQKEHRITGRGIIDSHFHGRDWDCYLSSIESGMAQNYEGLSGSPVVSAGRIVGILQMQIPNESGQLGLQISSVQMFASLIPVGLLKETQYEIELLEKCWKETKQRIAGNINNRKYIPDIFVEDGELKETVRYFADPCLFLKKAIKECKAIDFSVINKYLRTHQQNSIDFSSVSESVDTKNVEEIASILTLALERVSNTLASIDKRNQRIWEENKYVSEDVFNNSIRSHLTYLERHVEYTKVKYLLLSKKAGQGKTNFVCDFTSNFLLKKNYCVWYINAFEIRTELKDSFQRLISIDGKYSQCYYQEMLYRIWTRTGHPFVVVIDGLNENTVMPNWEDNIRDLLIMCNELPYIKVIMTTREEFIRERFVNLLEYDKRKLKHVLMGDSDETFRKRIFRGYLKFFDISIRENTLTWQTYNKLTRDTLLLRFFCEVNEHKRQLYMYDIYQYELFGKYMDKKIQEYERSADLREYVDVKLLFEKVIGKICGYMIKANAYFQVPLRIFDHEEQRLIRKLLENEVIFREEETVTKGIRLVKEGVLSFTFDEFRDYCITNYWLENYDEQPFCKFWSYIRNENSTIREGIEKYIFYLSKTIYYETMWSVFQKLDGWEDIYWRYIWDIESKYIASEDEKLFIAEILSEGECANQIIDFLIRRFDIEYFEKANIKLLFEALDVKAESVGAYDRFIRKLFSLSQKDKYGYAIDQEEFLYDQMLYELERVLDHKTCNESYAELIRLTVYLFDIFPSGTTSVWIKVCRDMPDVAIDILKTMGFHCSSIIKGNVKDIISDILSNGDCEKIEEELKSFDEKLKWGQGISEMAQEIRAFLKGGSI